MTIKITKTGRSKWGFYLQLEDGSFKGCEEAVSTYLTSKIPCEIEVEEIKGEGKQEKITRVKILGQIQESPIETVRPGEPKLVTESIDDGFVDNRQKSIESQMSIKGAIDMIRANNEVAEFDKVKINKDTVYQHALVIRQILADLKRS